MVSVRKITKKDLIQYLVERSYLFVVTNVRNNDGQGLLFHLLLKYHKDVTPIKATSKQKTFFVDGAPAQIIWPC